jgi:hypothetical protein
MVKGIPTSTIDAQVCDMVSGEMYGYFPWSWTVSAFGAIPLVDGQQDYSNVAGLYRLLRARLVRTDTTPDQVLELTVRQTLSPDLDPVGWTAITDISNEEGVGLLRLNRAVSVPTGMTLQIQGEYQVNPTKITATSQGLWFPDEYMPVACEGLLYWYYRLADDPRAVQQYAAFHAALKEMSVAEDYPATLQVFPDDSLGVGQAYIGSLNIFGS